MAISALSLDVAKYGRACGCLQPAFGQKLKDMALANGRRSKLANSTKKTKLTLHGVTDEEVQTRGLASSNRETVISRSDPARPDSTTFKGPLTISNGRQAKKNVHEMSATKMEPAPGGSPYSVYRCAGRDRFPFALDILCVTSCRDQSTAKNLAASRTVFIPKSNAPNEQGRIVRSPDALRPLTVCNCDCKILTTALCFGLQQRSISCFPAS